MKIFTNDMWCDTKLDWGYETDREFGQVVHNQNRDLIRVGNILHDILKFGINHDHLSELLDEWEHVRRISNYK